MGAYDDVSLRAGSDKAWDLLDFVLPVSVHRDNRVVSMGQCVANSKLHAAPCAQRQDRTRNSGAGLACYIACGITAMVVNHEDIVPTRRNESAYDLPNRGSLVACRYYD